MMYNNKLVASIKSNGKVLREFDKDTVYVPYGSEYSIYLKNLNTVRVIINIFVDGKNVTPNGFILYGGQEVDLERSIENGNLEAGNKFKFIERSGAIEAHRGIKAEDGLIRIEYQFEKVYVRPAITPNYPYTSFEPWNTDPIWTNDINEGYPYLSSGISTLSYNMTGSVQSAMSMTTSLSNAQSEVGITVPGSISNQKFKTASAFSTEITKHSIVLRLLGETEDNRMVREPITVKSKSKCQSCGKQNKATAKFCSECGTGLIIV